MSTLAGSLASMLDRPVVDLTEMKGTYDVDLEWVPDEREGGGIMAKMKGMAEAASADPHGDPAGPNGQSLFGALQEKVGVRLEPARPRWISWWSTGWRRSPPKINVTIERIGALLRQVRDSKILKLSERNGV